MLQGSCNRSGSDFLIFVTVDRSTACAYLTLLGSNVLGGLQPPFAVLRALFSQFCMLHFPIWSFPAIPMAACAAAFPFAGVHSYSASGSCRA